MSENSVIGQALADCGYMHVPRKIIDFGGIHRPLIFKATWSSKDVEHFIYVGKDAKGGNYFVGQFGVRAPIAEEFSIESILKYGHQNYRLVLPQRESDVECMMSFGFGRLDLAKGKIMPSLFLPDISPADLARLVADFVSTRLLPVVGQVTRLETLLQLLVADAEPCPWLAVNRAVRGAQIIAIGSHLGLSKTEIREYLTPYERLISMDLSQHKSNHKICVDRYVSQLFEDWVRWTK